MKTIFTFLTLLFTLNIYAQQNIEDVRSLVGQEVTVNGIVTNGNELGNIRYFQDETGGLAAYGSTLNNIQRGDSITISGTLKDYRNLLEIDPVANVVVHTTGNKLPDPVILNIEDIGEIYEGQLIQINNVEIVGSSGTFSGNQNYTFSDGVNSGVLRVSSYSSIVDQVIPTGVFNLIAICSQFSYNENNVQTGYQLLPRDMADFVTTNSVSFTAAVQVQEITSEGFALIWETDVNATTEVKYGFSPDQSTWEFINSEIALTEDNGFLHKAYLTGLNAATIVYAQAFSVLESDTAFSSVGVFGTQSSSTGDIKVYFNSDVDHNVSTGTLAVNIDNAMEDTLIAYIDRAMETIDFCIYNINNNGLSNVSEALNNAKDRGVKIRFITCESTAHFGTNDLDNEIPVLERPEIQDGGLMHNKFVVFDAESADPNKSWVWSGSTNLTYDQINTDANNMVFVQDQTLAKAYQIEFEEMWGSEGDEPNAGNAKFGAEKTDNTPHEFMIGNIRVESYFSPSDNTNQKIIESINSADNDFNVETMLITRSDLANAIKAARTRGVEVHVLNNQINDNTEPVNLILNEALPDDKFIYDNLVNGMLHNKVAIVDANYSVSDPQVITGSHNWSYSANDRNDENTLIFHDAEIANVYFQQFAQRFEENSGNLFVDAEEIQFPEIRVYPNPATDKLEINSSESITGIQLFSLSGQKLQERFTFNNLKEEFNLNGLLPGIYILKVQVKSGKLNSYKIVKQ